MEFTEEDTRVIASIDIGVLRHVLSAEQFAAIAKLINCIGAAIPGVSQ